MNHKSWSSLNKKKKTEPKFIVDRMYYRVARILRMLGYDTVFDPDFVDSDYIRIGNKDNRILITRDADLRRRAEKVGIETVTIDAQTISERLVLLHKKAKIELKIRDSILSRCTLCNSQIEIVDKKEVEDKLLEGTKEVYDEFLRCKNPDCQQIYWKGPHWNQLIRTLKESKKIVKEKD
jgi:uncharacterized protein with PIN domain